MPATIYRRYKIFDAFQNKRTRIIPFLAFRINFDKKAIIVHYASADFSSRGFVRDA